MAKYATTLTGPQIDSAITDMASHESERYAKGTASGIPATPGEVGYQDNSYYYKEQARVYAEQSADMLTGFRPNVLVGGALGILNPAVNAREFSSQTTLGGNGAAKIERIKGNSVKFNQLVQNGDFADTSGWSATQSTFTVSGNVATLTFTVTDTGNARIGQSVSIVQGHKYHVHAGVKSSVDTDRVKAYQGSHGAVLPISSVSLTAGVWGEINSVVTALSTATGTFVVGREGQKTAGETLNIRNVMVVDLTTLYGSAITGMTDEQILAKFKSEYPLPYYAYTATPSVVNLTATGIKTDSDPNLDHPWTSTLSLSITTMQGTPTGSQNAEVMFPYGMVGVGAVYDELRSASAVKRFGRVDLGSLTWSRDSTYGGFSASVSDVKPSTLLFLCPVLTALNTYFSWASFNSYADMSIGKTSTGTTVYVKATAYTDAASFKAAMSGVYLYYELASPVSYTISPEAVLNYRVGKGGTETLLPMNTATPTTAPIKADICYPYDLDALFAAIGR